MASSIHQRHCSCPDNGRRLGVSLLFLIILVSLTIPVTASEMRGLWVDAWHEGIWTPEQTAEMVKRAKECNFNVLFVQVRKRGNVFYRSKIEPISKDVATDYDPLADVITKAHAAGIQVHAWLIAYQIYPDNERDTPDAPDRVHVMHPDWLMADTDGQTRFGNGAMYLDPGLPEVQAYIISIVEELASNYEIDGVHWDRVIYPRRESGYNPASVARFNNETQREATPKPDDSKWCEWRVKQVTRLMRMTSETLKRIRPKAQVSASVVSDPKEARYNRFQDWPSWLESGVMDYAVPMVFVRDTELLKILLPDLLKAGKGKPVYVGIGAWQLTAEQSVEQVRAAREADAPGVVVYSYDGCSRPGDGGGSPTLDALKARSFAQPVEAPDMTATPKQP